MSDIKERLEKQLDNDCRCYADNDCGAITEATHRRIASKYIPKLITLYNALSKINHTTPLIDIEIIKNTAIREVDRMIDDNYE